MAGTPQIASGRAPLSGGHAHGLFVHESSVVHRLHPECKLVAALLFVLAVVSTPREAFWAFGFHAALVVVSARLARVPLRFVARRLVLEAPFLLFAAFLPLVGGRPHAEVLGLSLSLEGLWGAWNIAAKASLGAAVAILLAATTPMSEILRGLERLRAPRTMTAVAAFMVRYADVVTGEMSRMKIARESRAYQPRRSSHMRAVAATAGTLFIRSYERGERVYLCMLSRGFTGALPVLESGGAPGAQWGAALALPLAAVGIALVAWTVGR